MMRLNDSVVVDSKMLIVCFWHHFFYRKMVFGHKSKGTLQKIGLLDNLKFTFLGQKQKITDENDKLSSKYKKMGIIIYCMFEKWEESFSQTFVKEKKIAGLLVWNFSLYLKKGY